MPSASTRKLLDTRLGLKRWPSGMGPTAREVVPAVTCTAQASLLTGQSPARARHRRQRLAVPRHGRGPLLAAVERPDPGRADLRDGQRHGRGAGPDLPGGQALLVVQPGRRRRDQRHAQALLRMPTATRSFGISGTPEGLTERLETHARPLPVPYFLGPRRRSALHRSGSRGRAAQILESGPARPDARLSAAPGLRSAALRPVRLRHAPTGPRAGRRLRPAARRRPRRSGPRVWVVSEYGHCDVVAAGLT